MIKYTFVVLAGQHEDFMERLQELGLVDVTSKGWEPSDQDRALMSLAAGHREAVEHLRAVAASTDYIPGEAFSTGAEAFECYRTAQRKIAAIEAERARLEKLLIDAAPLGDLDPARIRELEAHGIDVAWLLETAGIDGAADVKLPDESPAAVRSRIDALEVERREQSGVLARAAASVRAIEAEEARLSDRLQFSRTIQSGTSAADGSLVVMEAWARQKQTDRVERMLEQHPAVMYIKERPTPQDETPVELHNAPLARPFEFIAEMYALPRYGTMDLTRWFAPFYMLFFGFCLADAGYGLLILGGGVFLALRGSGAMRSIGTLSIYCGAAAAVFGFFAGSMFGLDIKTWFPLSQGMFFTSNALFSLALAVGVVQILFGMVLKVVTTVRAFGVKWALSTIGWIVVLSSGIALVAPGMIGISLGIPPVVFHSAIGVGVFMMLFLNSPGKNPFVNLGSGLWNTYNDVTGFLSDALSYIRLFAIGLSGGVLAMVFNDLAVGLSGDIPVLKQIFMLVILLVGHGLNLFMSTLSSMVHPLRLTFVEFYKNAGFEASGRIFDPLKKSAPETMEKTDK